MNPRHRLAANTPVFATESVGGSRAGHLVTLLRSPFAMMPLWIVSGTVLYTFGWSKLFAPLRADTLGFLAVAAVLFLLLATSIGTPKSATRTTAIDPFALAVIAVYFLLAYIENGGIPLVQIAFGVQYDIYGFGVDGLHIVMLCFTGYYGVRAWAAYLAHKSPVALGALILITAVLISIGNRSAVSFLAFACAIVYVRMRLISASGWVMLALLGLLFAFLFGKFGDVRLAYQITQATGEPGSLDAVLQLARATDEFRASGISPSWLWAYTYFVSPLANLNAAFATADSQLCGQACQVAAVTLYDLLPDALGVRVADAIGVLDILKKEFLVAPDLTASTAFGSAVAGAGIVGGLLVLFVTAGVAATAVVLLRRSPVREEGLAILATLIFFSFFENMIAYTALLGQLAIPCSLGIVAHWRGWRAAPTPTRAVEQSF